jgi:hypothetical protein
MVIRLRSTWGWLTPLRCSFRSASCVMRRAKNAIRDTQYPIRYILLYNCKECSTNRPCFMQNKANFRKSQMDVNLSMTKYYEKKSKWTFGENKPNFSEDRGQKTEISRRNLVEKHGRTLSNKRIMRDIKQYERH